jgi:hypothetical protein
MSWRGRGIVRRYKAAANFRRELAMLPGQVAYARWREGFYKRWGRLPGDGKK